MIRKCTDTDLPRVREIINDGARAYEGVIPADRWHEPYMSREELAREVESGVTFWGYEEGGALAGVMGIQDRGEVALIRHAYVLTRHQGRGIGSRLLQQLESTTAKSTLVGTWADARWAIAFYERCGYRQVPPDEKTRLLKRYWNIPDRQVETSVVLAGPGWQSPVHP